uniref:Uncharacterized protein n=1 Tax=Clytia hemisphaerica TaxID=252671 RepID=A0A7M5XLK3_9CNID
MVVNKKNERERRERAATLPSKLITSPSHTIVQRNLNTFLMIPSLEEMRKTLRQMSSTVNAPLPSKRGRNNTLPISESIPLEMTSKSNVDVNGKTSTENPTLENHKIQSTKMCNLHNYGSDSSIRSSGGERRRRGVVISLGVDQLRYTIIEPGNGKKNWHIRSYGSILKHLNEILSRKC